MQELRRLSSSAVCFGLLLHLKRYLKKAYGLTTSRCQAYNPNEATK
ncbi:unnamed protein product, partial [Discosporangium mesarthrocarpum]